MALDPIEIARLNALGDRLRRIQVEFSTTRESTPVNLATERERVTEAIARGQILVPEFRYRAADNSSIALVSEASDLLRSSAASATDWDALVHEEVRMHLRTLEALRSHDADVITSLTLSRFGAPTPALISLAEAIIATPVPEVDAEGELTASEAADEFSRVIEESGLSEWAVEVVNDMHARVAVNSQTRTLKLSGPARFSRTAVERLIVHEIGTHILRATNGGRQRLRLLALPLGTSELTEEGLAVLNEARAGVLDARDVRKYALRALAGAWSNDGGFAEVVERLLLHTDVRSAVEIAIRAKRGIQNLTVPGAHMKDISYLAGYVEVARHVAAHPADYDLLMSVKQPLERLPLLRAAQLAGVVDLWPGRSEGGVLPHPRKPWRHPDGDPLGWIVRFAPAGEATAAVGAVETASQERGGVELSAMVVSMHQGRSSSVDRVEKRRIVGDISLDEASVMSTLEFIDCTISGTFSARNASLRSIRFVDCEIGRIDLTHSRVDGDIVIENSTVGTGEGSAVSGVGLHVSGNFAADARSTRFKGTINLEQAHIGGRIELKNADIEGSHGTLTNGDSATLGLVLTRASAINGLRLRGATVRGQLRGIGFRSGGQVNLTELRVQNPGHNAIMMQRGVFESTVLARGVTVTGCVDFSGSVVNGNLVLEGLILREPREGEGLVLNDVRCDHLKLKGTALEDPKRELKNPALFERATPREHQRRSTVEGSVLIRSAVVKERIELDALQVAAEGIGVDLSGAEAGHLLARLLTIESTSGRAINAESFHVEGRADLKDSDFTGSISMNNATVGAFVSLRRCEWHGGGESARLSMRAAKVERDVDLSRVRLPAGSRVDASGLSVSGTFRWRDIENPPKLDLDSAHVHELDDDKSSWPHAGGLNLAGCVIDQFSHGGWDQDSVDERLEWVGRQESFAPDAYQTLASHYRAGGSEFAARRVLLKLYSEEIAATPSRARRARQRIWYALTGYGYRLNGVAWLAVAVIALSVISAFWAQANGALMATDSSSMATATACTHSYPCFDPFIFGVDAAVPIVDLHHADFWVPDRSTAAGAAYDILITLWAVLGWLTLTVAAGGIAQRITR